MRTLIIAEPGGSHDGNLDTMRRLIDVAASCGADVYKSQWTSSAETMCARRHAPEYLDDYRKLQYPLAWHGDLAAYAHSLGLRYGCSTYIPGDPTAVAPFVDYLKIASFEAEDQAFYREVILAKACISPLASQAYTGWSVSGRIAPVIVSTGMQDSVAREWRIWDHRKCYAPLHVLHCVSAYPAPVSSLNLSLCSGNGQYDGEPCYTGLSDHSHDVRVGAWAVAAGARVLEAHYRLDDCDPANKDYAVAFTPAEFAEYIRNVRDVEAAMGDGIKRIQPAEEPMLRYRSKT